MLNKGESFFGDVPGLGKGAPHIDGIGEVYIIPGKGFDDQGAGVIDLSKLLKDFGEMDMPLSGRSPVVFTDVNMGKIGCNGVDGAGNGFLSMFAWCVSNMACTRGWSARSQICFNCAAVLLR